MSKEPFIKFKGSKIQILTPAFASLSFLTCKCKVDLLHASLYMSRACHHPQSSSPRQSVGAAAKFGLHHARAPEAGEIGVEFVFAFLLARGVLATWHVKAILCITKIKLNGSADVRTCMLTNSIEQRKNLLSLYLYVYVYIPAAQVGDMRVQDVTTRRMQMAAAMECTALIVSTLESTILLFCDANGLMLLCSFI